MKTISRQILFVYFLFSFMAKCSDVEKREITFIVTVPDSLITNDTLYIAGSIEQLGNWQPNVVPLIRINTNKWQLNVELPLHERIEYKFTRGSWNKEEVLTDGTIPGNKYLTVLKDQKVSHQIQNWRDSVYKPVGGITGNLRYHHNIYANRLKNERTIVVWLPENYETDLHKHYPVLYVHDGQNLFDPNTSYMGIDWQLDETADSLIKKGEIEEIIIVGIYNTPDRLEEYSDTEKGRAYMHFIINDLKPFIDNNYRTMPDRNHATVMGSSMGGLISFYLVWRYPEIFSQAACLSSTFLWNQGEILKEVENFTGQKKNIRIYFDNGGVGLERKYTLFFHKMRDLLISKGFELGKDLEYFYDEKGDHSERTWAKRAWRPLKFLFGIQQEERNE